MLSHKIRVIVLALTAVGLATTASVQADIDARHTEYLTFSRPVALPGVVLPAGSYTFDVASPTALDVVVVRNPKTGHVLYMGFTTTVTRPPNMSKETPIVFGEAAANEARPIATWYEIGQPIGHQFLYR
jgi:hypothetical protein